MGIPPIVFTVLIETLGDPGGIHLGARRPEIAVVRIT